MIIINGKTLMLTPDDPPVLMHPTQHVRLTIIYSPNKCHFQNMLIIRVNQIKDQIRVGVEFFGRIAN